MKWTQEGRKEIAKHNEKVKNKRHKERRTGNDQKIKSMKMKKEGNFLCGPEINIANDDLTFGGGVKQYFPLKTPKKAKGNWIWMDQMDLSWVQTYPGCRIKSEMCKHFSVPIATFESVLVHLVLAVV